MMEHQYNNYLSNLNRHKRNSSVSQQSLSNNFLTSSVSYKQRTLDDSMQYPFCSTFDPHLAQSNTLEISKSQELNDEIFSFHKLPKNSQMPRVHPFIKSKRGVKSLTQNDESILTANSPVYSIYTNLTSDSKIPQQKLNDKEEELIVSQEFPNYNQNLMSILNNIKLVNENIVLPNQPQQQNKNSNQEQPSKILKVDIIIGIEQELMKLKQMITQEEISNQYYKQQGGYIQGPAQPQQEGNHQRKNSKQFTFCGQQVKQYAQYEDVVASTQVNDIVKELKTQVSQISSDYSKIQSQLDEEKKENSCLEAKLIQLKHLSDTLKQQVQEQEKKYKQIKQLQDQRIAQLELEKYQIQTRFNEQSDQTISQNMIKSIHLDTLSTETLVQLKDQEFKLLQNKFYDLNQEYNQNLQDLKSLERELSHKNSKLNETTEELTEWKSKYQSLNKQIQILPNYTIELKYSNQKIVDLEKRVKELVEQNEQCKIENINLEIANKKYIELKAQNKLFQKEYDQMKSNNSILRNIQQQFQDYLEENQKEKERQYSVDPLASQFSSPNRNISTSFINENSCYQELEHTKRANRNSEGFNDNENQSKTKIQQSQQLIDQNEIIQAYSSNTFQEQGNLQEFEKENREKIEENYKKENRNQEEQEMKFQEKPDNLNNLNDDLLVEYEQLKNQIILQNEQDNQKLIFLNQQLEEYKSKYLELQENQESIIQNEIQKIIQNPENNQELIQLRNDNNQLRKLEQQLYSEIEELQKRENQNQELIENLNYQISQLEQELNEKNDSLEESFAEKMQMLSEITSLKEREKLLLKGNENLQTMYSEMRIEYENICIQDKLSQESVQFYKNKTEKTVNKYLSIQLQYEQLKKRLQISQKTSDQKDISISENAPSNEDILQKSNEEIIKMENQIQELQEQLALKENEKEILCKELNTLNLNIINKDKLVCSQNQNIQLLQSEKNLQQLLTEQSELQKIESQELKDSNYLEKEIDQKREHPYENNQQNQINQLKQLVQNGRGEIEKLYEVLNKRKDEYDQLKSYFDQKIAENEEMNKEIKQLAINNEDLQNQLLQKNQEILELSQQKSKYQQQSDRYFLEVVKKNKELIETAEMSNIIKGKYEDAVQILQNLQSKTGLDAETQQEEIIDDDNLYG